MIFEHDTSQVWDVGFLDHRGEHSCCPVRDIRSFTPEKEQRVGKSRRTHGCHRFEKSMATTLCRCPKIHTTYHRPLRVASCSTPQIFRSSCQTFGVSRRVCHRQDSGWFCLSYGVLFSATHTANEKNELRLKLERTFERVI